MRISRTILLGVLLSIAQVNSYASTNATNTNVCEKYSTVKDSLSRIYDEYSTLPMNPKDAEKLFLVYRRLDTVVKEAHALYSDYEWSSAQYKVISQCLWDDKFKKMGLSIGHYSDRLEYSEKLLADVHKLNPHSQYRNYTLYTEILGRNIGAELVGLPNIEQAKLYLKEFPSGPYATKVYRILAGFYHDLFMSLRYGEGALGESNSCYEEYIAKHPEEAKPERAKELGISYFEKVIAATPPKDVQRPMYLKELNALKKGETDSVINWCTD